MSCLCSQSLKIGGVKNCACLMSTLERTAPTTPLDEAKTHLLGGYDQSKEEWVCDPSCWCKKVKQ